ncbi:hypothetical protein RFI_01400 [Reticulomyxa filosa]|uniref:Uncharacterized protein n=1 Tax=Reticulomyxa filosa TaxID=46433 RepID=X6PDB1_RETFI|nr:hypothetical protein RFI_01400 [Reticulomyxa filosa]|eukprot:ETO35662.1 hypothetical protein RFI_01400 [Reticulomyxa filosa]
MLSNEQEEKRDKRTIEDKMLSFSIVFCWPAISGASSNTDTHRDKENLIVMSSISHRVMAGKCLDMSNYQTKASEHHRSRSDKSIDTRESKKTTQTEKNKPDTTMSFAQQPIDDDTKISIEFQRLVNEL